MNKVKSIIKEHFDERCSLMVLAYLLGQIGMENAAKITDEEIEAVEGNALMTDEFVRSLIRCSREIAKNCDFTIDIIPYIVDNFDYIGKEKEELYA